LHLGHWIFIVFSCLVLFRGSIAGEGKGGKGKQVKLKGKSKKVKVRKANFNRREL
jgi:hypothetical protein